MLVMRPLLVATLMPGLWLISGLQGNAVEQHSHCGHRKFDT
jgi:hypothetical protein